MRIHKFDYFRASISIGILLLSLSFAYYFVYYLPHKATIQIEQQKQEKLKNSRDLHKCLLDADKSYSDNWASNCKSDADRVGAGYQNCLNTSLSAGTCRSLWGTPDANPDCSLPMQLVNSLNDQLKTSKDECYRLYPQR